VNKIFASTSTLLILTALCAAAQTTPPQQTASPQRIAVIDMQSALISTKDGQKAVADLRAKYSPKDQELQKRQQQMAAKQEEYRKTQNTISEEAKARLERDIETLDRGLQRDVADAKQDMDQDQQRLLQDLGGKLMQVLTKYATDNKITMVFDVSGQPNNLLFASNTIDITRDIIALYDKSASGPAATPPTSSTTPSTTSAPFTGTPAAPAARPAATPSSSSPAVRRPATAPAPGSK
jgi:outer membrane protein